MGHLHQIRQDTLEPYDRWAPVGGSHSAISLRPCRRPWVDCHTRKRSLPRGIAASANLAIPGLRPLLGEPNLKRSMSNLRGCMNVAVSVVWSSARWQLARAAVRPRSRIRTRSRPDNPRRGTDTSFRRRGRSGLAPPLVLEVEVPSGKPSQDWRVRALNLPKHAPPTRENAPIDVLYFV